ncbi:HTH_38 domain-containing protein [Trichonephila clavipes]|nr:HTH_38 domain-containing protein [Trichonephila clavipes]
MSRRKQRSAFDQVSEFDRRRIVAYRYCGLSFRKIGSRVGRNQTTVMWTCYRWMQGDMTASVHQLTVYKYHSTTFTAEWFVCKTSIAWSTLDVESQTSPPPMVR